MKISGILLNVFLIFLLIILTYQYFYSGVTGAEMGISLQSGATALRFRIIDLFAVTVILSVFAYTLFLNSERYRYNSILTDYISPSPVLSYSSGFLSLLFFIIGLGVLLEGNDVYSSAASVFLISFGYLSGIMGGASRKENKSKYYILFLGLIFSLLASGIAGIYYLNVFFGDFIGGNSGYSGNFPDMTFIIKNLIVMLATMKVCEIYEYILNI